ncbi:MAG: hypothetical protein P8Z37_18860 [Acidobacteriota bacterium]
MSMIHQGLSLIIQRFPSERDRLRRLYLSNTSFQSLCDDYQKCTEALEHWSGSNNEKALERTREYGELKQSLEREVEEHIRLQRFPH